MFLDPLIRQIDFSKRKGLGIGGNTNDNGDHYEYTSQDEFNIQEELEAMGYQPGLNI